MNQISNLRNEETTKEERDDNKGTDTGPIIQTLCEVKENRK